MEKFELLFFEGQLYEGSFGGLFWTFDEVSPEFQKEGGSGFPIGGGANRPGWAPTYDSTKFSKNCMKLSNLWAVGGAHRGRPLDPPLHRFLLVTAPAEILVQLDCDKNATFHICRNIVRTKNIIAIDGFEPTIL